MLALLLVISIAVDPADPAVDFTPAEVRRILSMSPVPAPPPDPTNRVADDPAAVALGQHLFFETRLSSTNTVSCATCHDPARDFTDGLPRGIGVDELDRHTPDLWNVAHRRWMFWDGRADTLWAQALLPFEHEKEFASTRVAVVGLLYDDPALRASYERVFGPLPDLADAARFPRAARPVPERPDDPRDRAWRAMAAADRAAIDTAFVNVGKAIAAYERRLRRADAPFDRFAAGLRDGDPDARSALTPSAQRGLKLFVGRASCRTCHFGPLLSDGEFHNTGVPPTDGGEPTDPGRYRGVGIVQASPFNAAGPHSDERDGAAAARVTSIAGSTESWGQFKTPSLRNVALTPPYMHEGQLATLDDVLHFYSTLEGAILPGHHAEQILRPLNLTAREIGDLAAFLHALTGEPPDPGLLRDPRPSGEDEGG